MTKRTAVVALSGGVDSSVAAALLVERGFSVTGIMLKLWRGEAANLNSGCCNLGAAEDARRVADTLGIPFYVLNFAERFEETVVRDFHATYAAGRTPNPCVRCNQWIKFDALLERADVLGAEFLATGHYAHISFEGGRYRLRRGADERKDQSYVLWMLRQRQLGRALFPVGGLDKAETRRIARDLGLRTAAKPESQEICFVRGGDLGAHLDEHLGGSSEPGPILDVAGRELGRHRGVARYTIGQRKGLGISVGEPVFVTSIDARANTLVVGRRADLGVGGISVDELSFVGPELRSGADVLVQHRAHGEVNRARLETVRGSRARLSLVVPAAAVAPGQSVALYSTDDPDELLGGGVVSATLAAA